MGVRASMCGRASIYVGVCLCELRKLPPSSEPLFQHTKRACYQAGYLWNESFENIDLPDPSNWGWATDENGKLKPLWKSECSNIEVEIFITSCSCQKAVC